MQDEKRGGDLGKTDLIISLYKRFCERRERKINYEKGRERRRSECDGSVVG